MNDYPLRPPAAALRNGVAMTLLGVGSLGLVLPVVPGIPLLIIGALLLRRREPARLPLAAALRRADLTPIERIQVRSLLAARRLTMAAESTRRTVRARRDRQRRG